MATRKKTSGTPQTGPQDPQEEQYQALLVRYGKAIEAMQKGDLETARDELSALATEYPEEQELGDRARTWLRICQRKLAPELGEPADANEAYTRAVLLLNDGEAGRAIELLDRCLQSEPNSVRFLYARASAHALEGRTDKAVADLRQAISADPTVRFQAVNDTDFERIREEPSFIDIIEPTPTGA